MSLVSLVLAILSIFGLFIGFFPCLGWINWFNLLLASTSLILGIIVIVKDEDENKLALIGVIISGVVIFIGFFRLILGGGIL